MSAFVIASPEARSELDRVDFGSLGLWDDDWWTEAQAGGLMTIESHSWDHNRPSLQCTQQRDGIKGSFLAIDNEADAEAQLAQASGYIEARTGRPPRYFAYPWSQIPDFLADDYLPRRGPQLGLRAAFGGPPGPIEPGQSPWRLPRYICGQDWQSPEELQYLLKDAFGST